jgi:hypothetical protein
MLIRISKYQENLVGLLYKLENVSSELISNLVMIKDLFG